MAVRDTIEAAFAASSVFQDLPPERQARLREDMSAVLEGIAAGAPPPPVEPLRRKPDDDGGRSSLKEGVQAIGDFERQVGFTAFVKSLVTGVYEAIVHSSIEQMEAYAKLVEAVTGPVAGFANTNITDNQAGDYLASLFPTMVSSSSGGFEPLPGQEAPDISKEFPKLAGSDLSDRNAAKALVLAAKLRLAEQRQQLLATMVLMGINRIVVTNGRINASMSISIDTSKARTSDRSRSLSGQGVVGVEANASAPVPTALAGVPLSGDANAHGLLAST